MAPPVVLAAVRALATARKLRRRKAAMGAAAAAVGTVGLVVTAVVAVALAAGPPPEVAGGLGLHPVALDAYRRAAESSEGVACGLRWPVLAAIAKVESDHAAGREIAPNGTVSPPVLGQALVGTAGTVAVADTDGGRLDGDTSGDRAVGPLQFLPATWARYGVDGNGDGLADPHNLYDAASAAAALVCEVGLLAGDDALRAALGRNASESYVEEVLGWIAHYDEAVGQSVAPIATGTLVTVRGIAVDQVLAASLEALLAAAEAEGLALGGSGYRSTEEQVALRRAHCGSSRYAVYEMPAAACHPPTARPGESRHEAGLAVDFTCYGVLMSSDDRCFPWLVTNAAAFGLRNLESEPWHWSLDGR